MNWHKSLDDGMAKTTLDARWLVCPLPVLRAAKAMKKLASGDIIEILATDANAVADFEAFCKSAGHELVEKTENDGVIAIVIRRKN